MKGPLYRQALSHGWNLAWQHKFLWVFGLFAAFLGQMGLLELFTKVSFISSKYTYPDWVSWPQVFRDLFSGFGYFSLNFDGWDWLGALLLLLVGLCVASVFLSVVSQGALIESAAKATKSKKLPKIEAAWHVGVVHFWKLFFLNFIKKVTMVLLAMVLGYATINFVLAVSFQSFILFLLIFLLVGLVGLVLSFLVIYAAGYIVVEKYSWLRAVESAWRLFLDHWLVSIEVGLLVLVLNILLGVVVLLGFWVVFVPVLVVWFIATVSANTALWIAGLFAGVVIFLAFVIWVGSVFSVFITSIWTYLFMKMHKHGIVSRVLHWGGHHKIK